MQFEGPAARWLASVQSKFAHASWQEFSAAVVHRFGRNQHQTLIRRLYRLQQTDSVDDYILEFSALMDQLSAYEPNSDMMHYTTRFIDGLKPAARVIVAVQRPQISILRIVLYLCRKRWARAIPSLILRGTVDDQVPLHRAVSTRLNLPMSFVSPMSNQLRRMIN